MKENEMVTKNTKNPAPVAVMAEDNADEANTNVVTIGAKDALKATSGGTRKNNLFTQAATAVSRKAAEKVNLMGNVRQKLAEAADLYKEGDDKAGEAREVAGKAALTLYQARIDGLLSGDEVSATLGDTFGYKNKSDGTPGKTPAGQGEAIRKRVVRMAQAFDYVQNGDGGRFFEGLPEEEIQDVLKQVEDGDITVFWAYDRFAEIKREHLTRTEMAFDPKRIGNLVEKLSEEGSADIIRNDPLLIAAYGALIDILNVIGEQQAEAA
jgi:hypothetical protein